MAQRRLIDWSAEARGLGHFLRTLVIVILLAMLDTGTWLLFPPGTAGLPPGASHLELQTQPARFGSRVVLGCPAAVYPDLRVTSAGPAMVFIRVGGSGGAEASTGPDGRIHPVWPPGWSARLVGGRAELVDPEGQVIARDGDVIRGLGGGNSFDRSLVCLTIGANVGIESPQS